MHLFIYVLTLSEYQADYLNIENYNYTTRDLRTEKRYFCLNTIFNQLNVFLAKTKKFEHYTIKNNPTLF